MVHWVGDELGANGDLALVTDALARLRESGTGADWQRRAYARRNSLVDVVADSVRRTVGESGEA